MSDPSFIPLLGNVGHIMKGIGWHLLKACEELISKMNSSLVVYLHCRVIDDGPLSLYKKAGYSIIKTDNILVWLRLQQRKHLMFKELAPNTLNFDDQPNE
ncbi:hypothetical protein Taro_010629 [Colocasia esculenta]|uniref:N-acetyltransferase domain-containing protein n=1 Tax=Colocasia esculenta TaxID=4460 RepID=A0A843U847_COLES|nr:hypothetical protein [Colocasia esculenta]